MYKRLPTAEDLLLQDSFEQFCKFVLFAGEPFFIILDSLITITINFCVINKIFTVNIQ